MKPDPNQKWHAWHDDGRTAIVKGRDSREALQDALESFSEQDQNVIAVECFDSEYEEQHG